ncbi:MAG: CDP-alcohol phosphatidyltransferase family protein [Actinobacteria bacterium]|nr:MAG: CDP-alcohol phosphatidyltransferase family protein [Actinomycetota bacterium]
MREGLGQVAPGFGPSALATPANAVTAGRVVASPALLALILSRGASWSVLAVWIVLSVSDGLDGWVARRQGATRSGAFLDPLADKCLVICALVALVAKEEVWWIPAMVLTARELGISLYRSWAGRRGITVPARPWAKVKTVVEDVAVGFALLPPVAAHHKVVIAVFLWAAVALALWTGAQYLLDGRRLLEGRTVEPRAV